MTVFQQLSLEALLDDLQPITVPGASAPIEGRVLRRDDATHAVGMLVRFPPGWQREAGHYTCAEHVVVLAGSLTINGTEWSAGDGLVIPSRCARETTTTPTGAVAIGWFAAQPRWRPGRDIDPAESISSWSGTVTPAQLALARDYVDLINQLWWHETATDAVSSKDSGMRDRVMCYVWPTP